MLLLYPWGYRIYTRVIQGIKIVTTTIHSHYNTDYYTHTTDTTPHHTLLYNTTRHHTLLYNTTLTLQLTLHYTTTHYLHNTSSHTHRTRTHTHRRHWKCNTRSGHLQRPHRNRMRIGDQDQFWYSHSSFHWSPPQDWTQNKDINVNLQHSFQVPGWSAYFIWDPKESYVPSASSARWVTTTPPTPCVSPLVLTHNSLIAFTMRHDLTPTPQHVHVLLCRRW